jgi:hypothetical protein
MHFSLPSPAHRCRSRALLVAAGGSLLPATGNADNITDPVTPTNKAKVDSSGRLAVGRAPAR